MFRSDAHHLPIYRELVTSASAICDANCSHTFSRVATCHWYHRAWPILRLIDAVSTPYWHADFYHFAIRQYLERTAPERPYVLVAGAADFAMGALVHEAVMPSEANLCIVDQCRSALEFNRVWANRVARNVAPELLESEILACKLDRRYDIAVSDAFLTRFESHDRPTLLRAIFNNLTPDGIFITTIRDHSRPVEPRGQRLISPNGLTSEGISELSKLGLDEEECIDWSEAIRRYCLNMKSNEFGGISELHEMCSAAGLKATYAETAAVPGEYFQTLYLRVIISRQN